MKKVAELIQRREWIAAEARLIKLKNKSPFDHQLLFNLSYVFNEQGKVDEAISALRQCLAVAPEYIPAMLNISILLMRIGEQKQALRYAQMATFKQPNEASLHYHLSLLWKACKNSAYALEAVDNALRLKPQSAPWRVHRMQLLSTLQRDEEAANEANRLKLIPEYAENLEVLHTLNSFHAAFSEWEKVRHCIKALVTAISRPEAALNPASLMMSLDVPSTLIRLARNATKDLPARQRPPRKWRGGRMTIGYLTTDVREHPVAQMLFDVLPHHDHERFEIVLIRLAPSDGSEIADKIASMMDRVIDLIGVADVMAALKIQEAGIDIIIDLMGLTAGHRTDLLAMRPCATQILWLGCPVSTGCTHYDAFIVDDVVAPSGYEEFCSEPLLRLSCCYHPISQGLHNQNSTLTREHLGIPRDAPLIGLLQQPNRIRPEFIEMMARVFARHPSAHLMIRVKLDSIAHVKAQLTEWGILPEQIHFLQHFKHRDDYLRVVSLIDLILDSYPYGGHSTMGEALSLGTPVLTCYGHTIHGRVAASMMHELELYDLVTTSPEEQRDMLDRLLAQPDLLAIWKQRFKNASMLSPDTRHIRLVRELENAYGATLRSATKLDRLQIDEPV